MAQRLANTGNIIGMNGTGGVYMWLQDAAFSAATAASNHLTITFGINRPDSY